MENGSIIARRASEATTIASPRLPPQKCASEKRPPRNRSTSIDQVIAGLVESTDLRLYARKSYGRRRRERMSPGVVNPCREYSGASITRPKENRVDLQIATRRQSGLD